MKNKTGPDAVNNLSTGPILFSFINDFELLTWIYFFNYCLTVRLFADRFLFGFYCRAACLWNTMRYIADI